MENQILNNLKQLLSINSKSSNIDCVNEVGNFIKNLLADLPLKWTPHKKEGAADFLIAETINNDPSKPMIILSAHMDTVLPAADIQVREEDGKVYGVGAQDVKGGIIVIIETLKKLHAENKLQNIILALSSQEELATPDFQDIISETAKKGDYIMVYEPTLNYEPYAQMNKRSVVVSRRGFKDWVIDIEGPGGHSGIIYEKEKRKSAILLMAEIILELEKLADYEKITTINSGVLNAGKAFNILAPNANLVIETRFQTFEEYERVSKDIKDLIVRKSEDKDFNIKLIPGHYFPPMQESTDVKPFIELCKKTAEDQNIEFIIEKRNGGSEASLYKHCNPNAIVLDGFGVRGDGEHTPKEFVFVESIFSSIDFSVEIIKKLLD